MKKLLLIIFALTASFASAQNYNFNFGGLQHSSGPSVPGSCSRAGSYFFKNSATKGWYICSGSTYAAVATGSVASAWGSITGTLSAQTDLQSALDAKLPLSLGGDTSELLNGHTLTLSGGQVINTGTYGPAQSTLPAFLAGIGAGNQTFVNNALVAPGGVGELHLTTGSGGYYVSLATDQSFAQGFESDLYTAGSANETDNFAAIYAYAEHDSTGTLSKIYAATGQVATGAGSGLVDKTSAFYAYTPAFTVNPTGYMAFYSEDLGGGASGVNPYYSWNDSRGVQRCKEDAAFNGTGQAICVLYNNQFAKYTPGAANFERLVFGEWDGSNVAHMGTEAGGTGTLRDLQLMGGHILLPVHSTTGTRYLCVDSAGTISASASACSGT